MLGSVGGESVNDAQLASEINEFIDRLITQGERSTKRFSGLPAIPSSLPFAAQETSATAPKSLVLGGDEQQQQQHEQQQQERRARRQRQQGAHVCSRTDCGKRFERSNALLRHIASIHNCKGVLCPFCVSKKKRFNRSDNFTRCVANYMPSLPLLLKLPASLVGDGGEGGLLWIPINGYVDMLPLHTHPSRGMTRGCWAP